MILQYIGIDVDDGNVKYSAEDAMAMVVGDVDVVGSVVAWLVDLATGSAHPAGCEPEVAFRRIRRIWSEVHIIY